MQYQTKKFGLWQIGDRLTDKWMLFQSDARLEVEQYMELLASQRAEETVKIVTEEGCVNEGYDYYKQDELDHMEIYHEEA